MSPLRLEGVQHATGEERRASTSSARKNEATGSKPKVLSSQGKPFNITVVQVYAPTTGAEEAEVDQFYEGLQHLLELTPKNDVLIIMGDWNVKVGSQKITGITGKFGLGVQNEAGHRLVEFAKRIRWSQQTLFSNNPRDDSTHGHHQTVNTEIRLTMCSAAKDGEALHNQKELNVPDNHDGVVTDLEPDILECEVKWALEGLSNNKASGGDSIPAELFKILKDDANQVVHTAGEIRNPKYSSFYVRMANKESDLETAEGQETDINTLHSESTYETESPEVCGGGYPTPEDESTMFCHSVESEEFDSQRLVTCTFSVSLAVPLILPTSKPWMVSRQDVQSTMSKAKEGSIPKMHRFYHMEYFLLPDDIDPRKLDLVLFGPLAKLYLETESKSETPKDGERPKSKKPTTLHISVVKPWLENNQIWVSWNHSIEINVTNDFLIKLRDHNIKLRLWDIKEKVCAKARFSKQKANVPHSEQGDIDGKILLLKWYWFVVVVSREVMSHRDPMENIAPGIPVLHHPPEST
ncbi:Craniofacial development protein 2 [Varanus komodoensis]|nr:Craniofacial development protein 2 [Varanus komodoensis]